MGMQQSDPPESTMALSMSAQFRDKDLLSVPDYDMGRSITPVNEQS